MAAVERQRRCTLESLVRLLVVVAAMTTTTMTCHGASSTSHSSSSSKWQYCTDTCDVDNPDWSDLKATLQVGVNSLGPAYGSTLSVNKDVTQVGSYAQQSTLQEIALHTPTHSYISRSNFNKMTRWYQEDSNTQIFRMFPGDDNIRNSRANAPRTEVFSIASWGQPDGSSSTWYEWSGRYTFLKVRAGAVLQIKHNVTYWSMQLILEENEYSEGQFDLYYVKLRNKSDKTLLVEDVVGQGVDIRVLDNGLNHKVYVNEELVVENSMGDRGESPQNRFRWGLYSPQSAMDRDILILVTGVQVGETDSNGQTKCSSSTMVSWIVPDFIQSWFASFFEFESIVGNSKKDTDNDEPDPNVLSQWYGNTDNNGYGYF